MISSSERFRFSLAEQQARFTPRELEILQLRALGFLNKEIVTKLGITERTVKNTEEEMYRRIGTKAALPTILIALKSGDLKLNELVGDFVLEKVNSLFPREREVLEVLSATGGTNQEIADSLQITERTVKCHLTNIRDKFCGKADGDSEDIEGRGRIRFALIYLKAKEKRMI